MLAAPIETTPVLPHDIDVLSVNFAGGIVNVVVQSISLGTSWLVRFYGAAGVRVLDEGDLLEFWPTCSSPNGPLFRISTGGWKDQESQRWGFLIRETQPELPEYFVAGRNACVSVLSFSPPEVFEEEPSQ